MAGKTKGHAARPKLLFGLKHSQHRTAKMQHILNYYQKRVGVRATKKKLLTLLGALQKEVSSEEAAGIQEWLQSNSDSATALKFILDDITDVDTAKTKGKAKVKSKAKAKFEVEREPSPPRHALRECSVCFEELPEASFPEQKLTSTCNHEPTTCRTCLATAVTTQIADAAWDQISCPECPETLPYDVKSLLAAFRTIPGFTMCLGPGCGSGQIHGGGDEEPIMTCKTCEFKTCFAHKMPWHTGQTCAQYDAARRERMEQESASDALIAQIAKACPNPECGHAIEKNHGCDHMTCIQCNYQFCWICFAPWLNIMRHGNHRHDPACKYHTVN
ncbi:uncharacterized protein LY89DRAFT_605984, partial [Mollisia scopiformis]